MANPRPLNRSELAKFLPDQRAIRAFEQLFDLIPEDLLALLAEIDETKLSAGNATSSANEALAQLTRMADALDILAKAPPVQKDTFLKGDYIDFPINGPHIPKSAESNGMMTMVRWMSVCITDLSCRLGRSLCITQRTQAEHR